MRYLFVLMFACVALTANAESGRYLIVADAKDGVWKIDTVTGKLWRCLPGTTGGRCFPVD